MSIIPRGCPKANLKAVRQEVKLLERVISFPIPDFQHALVLDSSVGTVKGMRRCPEPDFKVV
jgi:hypothetical protein